MRKRGPAGARAARRQPHTVPEPMDATPLLALQGEVTAIDLLPWGSNYTFLAQIEGPAGQTLAIYKPQRGEAPLWDFPEGTLYLREYAAYLVSESLGWSLIPPTTIRDGITTDSGWP